MRVAATTPCPRFAGRPITRSPTPRRIANAVIRHGDDDNLYKHFEDAAVDLVSAGIIHLGYVYRNLYPPREPTLPDVLAHYSTPGMDFTDVLVEMQKTVHMPGGKSEPAPALVRS